MWLVPDKTKSRTDCWITSLPHGAPVPLCPSGILPHCSGAPLPQCPIAPLPQCPIASLFHCVFAAWLSFSNFLHIGRFSHVPLSFWVNWLMSHWTMGQQTNTLYDYWHFDHTWLSGNTHTLLKTNYLPCCWVFDCLSSTHNKKLLPCQIIKVRRTYHFQKQLSARECRHATSKQASTNFKKC